MKPTEESEQMAVIEWRNWVSNRDPRVNSLYHIPNGELRNKAIAAKLKRMGVRAGMPDLHLPVPKFSAVDPTQILLVSLYIEMKTPKGRLSEAQAEVHKDLVAWGNHVEVCRSATQAIMVIGDWLAMDPRLYFPMGDEPWKRKPNRCGV